MIVFKKFFKILKQYKFIIILYTSILLLFTIFSSSANSQMTSFTISKPNVTIINLDGNNSITDNFIKYMEKNANIKEIENDEAKLDDALFYQEVNAVIYIYNGYTKDFLNNEEKNIEVKYGNDYYASYTDMLLERYFKIANLVNDEETTETTIVNTINKALEAETKIELDSKIDIDGLSRASNFFNFSNYSILAICIYITAIVILRFNDEKIKARNRISSKSINSITRELYLGNLVFAVIVWLVLIVLSFIIIREPMLTANGLFLMLNSFIFMTCGLSIGFLTGHIFKSQNAITAAVTIISLGASFICGSFIPVEYLPDTVVQFSKLLPSYWFIHNNNLITTIEVFNFGTIMPLIINMVIMLGFSVLYIIFTNIISKRKKK